MKQNKCDVSTLIKIKSYKMKSCAFQCHKEIQESRSQDLFFQPGANFYTDWAVLPYWSICIMWTPQHRVIQNVQVKKRRLILCGEWNINFMHDSRRLRDVQELLSLHNLVNTVRSLTRVTKNTASLIDVVMTDKESIIDIATVIDLGYWDNKVEVLQLTVKKMEGNYIKTIFWEKGRGI